MIMESKSLIARSNEDTLRDWLRDLGFLNDNGSREELSKPRLRSSQRTTGTQRGFW